MLGWRRRLRADRTVQKATVLVVPPELVSASVGSASAGIRGADVGHGLGLAGVGVVVSKKAVLLAQPATSSFVPHWGCNSCAESTCYGVPERDTNAFELVKQLGVAVAMRAERKISWRARSGEKAAVLDWGRTKRARAMLPEPSVASPEEGTSSLVKASRVNLPRVAKAGDAYDKV